MTDELKPVRCGCGGEAQTVCLNSYEAFVECKKCGIETKLYDTEAEAVTAWNRAMGATNVNIVNLGTVNVDM